jgi:hypothetical protein
MRRERFHHSFRKWSSLLDRDRAIAPIWRRFSWPVWVHTPPHNSHRVRLFAHFTVNFIVVLCAINVPGLLSIDIVDPNCVADQLGPVLR